MRDFETRYPINGSSALEPTRVRSQANGVIIAFPGAVSDAEESRSARRARRAAARRADLMGQPFEQLDRKSEILLGVLFTSVAALFVFLGM